MFFRQKPSGAYRYLQIVENYREGRKVRQRTLTTLGRLDLLQASGQMDALMRLNAVLKLPKSGGLKLDVLSMFMVPSEL